MKKILLILFASLLIAPAASARDKLQDFWINEVMSSTDAQEALGNSVLFFFGDEAHGKVTRGIRDVKTRKKTRALGKKDQEACHWVFLSAMKELKAQAIKSGANAVVNIRSYYKKDTTSSSEIFKCNAGRVVATVGLIGTIIEMEQ